MNKAKEFNYFSSSEYSSDSLESQINNWLESNPDIQIISVSTSSTLNEYGTHSIDALILYKDTLILCKEETT